MANNVLSLIIWSFIALGFGVSVQGKVFEWLPDQISINTDGIQWTGNDEYYMSININANGVLYVRKNSGHFRLRFSVQYANGDEYQGYTQCINSDSSQLQLEEALSNCSLYGSQYRLDFVSLFSSFSVKKYSQKSPSTSNLMYVMKFTGSGISYFNSSMFYDGCDVVQTVGEWHDVTRWKSIATPSFNDDVVIPEGSGVIMIRENVNVKSLNMSGGILISYKSSCPENYVGRVADSGLPKCYSLNTNLLQFQEAQNYCAKSGGGYLGATLMHISGYTELDIAKRLCRGLNGSSVRQNGCWIGLNYNQSTEASSWIESKAVYYTGFRDWNRNYLLESNIESNVSCVKILPWEDDPLSDKSGSFYVTACSNPLPTLCQTFGKTERYSLKVESANFVSGEYIGGDFYLATGSIESMTLSQGASITVLPSGKGQNISSVLIHTLFLNDGSDLHIHGNVTILNYVGDQSFLSNSFNITTNSSALTETQTRILSKIFHYSSSVIAFESSLTYSRIGSYVKSSGRIVVPYGNVTFCQGGDFSLASFEVADNSSIIAFEDNSVSMESFNSFDLQLSNVGIVSEDVSPLSQEIIGVYRISLSAPRRNISEITACIPYNSSALQLQAIINSLNVARIFGDATVRRYGSVNSASYKHGYTFRIDFSNSIINDALALEIACIGNSNINGKYINSSMSQCGCALTRVPNIGSTPNVRGCPRGSRSSIYDSSACSVPPSIIVSQVAMSGRSNCFGNGSILLNSGVHQLPQHNSYSITITNQATGIVSGDAIDWTTLSINSRGKLIITGPGWGPWDILSAASFNYDAPSFIWDSLKMFKMTVTRVILQGESSVIALSGAIQASLVDWHGLLWAGGVIGGSSTLFRVSIGNAILRTNTLKTLRFGAMFSIEESSNLSWEDGEINAIEGSALIVKGSFEFLSSGLKLVSNSQLVSQGRYLFRPINDIGSSFVSLMANSSMHVLANANITFLVPLNLMDASNVILEPRGNLNLVSGGLCENNARLVMSVGSILTLSGGIFAMETNCNVSGKGMLITTGGSHYIPSTVDALIVIEGGRMVWPLSRGERGLITFNGGLILKKKGVLNVQPFSTILVVQKEVIIRDNSFIQFPEIGIASQPTPSDRNDVPDNSPRANFTIAGAMEFLGGTISGKVDVNALTMLKIDGDTKYINQLAQLINHGLAVWGTGDIILDSNAKFLNLGTLQIRDDLVNTFTAGVLVRGFTGMNPVNYIGENYHSWDTDEGHLSYTQYIRIRTEFVSRAPKGWTEARQIEQDIINPL